MKRQFIYVAGPYTKGDVAVNVQQNILAGDAITKKGHIPFVPLLSHFWHMIEPHTFDFWMDLDIMWITRCDALLRMPGESSGADREVLHAIQLGLPVYYSLGEVPDAVET